MNSSYNNYLNRFIRLSGLEVGNIPEKLEFEGEVFTKKPEFHITLLSVENIVESINRNKIEELKTEIVDEFNKFVEEFPLTEYELSDELRLVRAEGNKTVIVMAKLKGMDKLFSSLSNKHGKELPVQPTHITLYYTKDSFGIPINSYKELEKTSELIDVPELKNFL
jgi:hypothetical protein